MAYPDKVMKHELSLTCQIAVTLVFGVVLGALHAEEKPVAAVAPTKPVEAPKVAPVQTVAPAEESRPAVPTPPLEPLLPPPSGPGVAPSASEDDEAVEVQRPLPFSDQELRVLRSSASLPIDQLIQLLQVYEKLENVAMMDALVRAVLKRDPANAEALRIRDGLSPEQETRPAGYLDGLAQQVLKGEKVEDTDSVALQANSLVVEGLALDAMVLLEKLQKQQFSGTWFPYLDDLAEAVTETGDLARAEKLYQEISTDTRFSLEARQEATQLLPSIALRRRIAALREAARGTPVKLVASAKALLNEMPNQYEAIVFYIEALDKADMYEEAIDYLTVMKSKAGNPVGWPWEPTLAYAYYGARRFDDASDHFRTISASTAYDPVTRMDAESMLVEIKVTQIVMDGLAGIDQGQKSRAEGALARLEADFPNHPDTLGYRAVLLAKNGHTDEALQLLMAKKTEATAQGLPFTQQDALADVYLERKEFGKARSATQEIISDPSYDLAMKQEAVLTLDEIALAELMEQGSIALQDGNRAKARVILGQLQQMAPQSLDVRIFNAEVELAYNRVSEAYSQLAAMKAVRPVGSMQFAGQNGLATAQYRLGDLEAADAGFREIEHGWGYPMEDVFDAVWQRRALAPQLRANGTIDNAFQSDNEGAALTTQARYSSDWHRDWRFGAFTTMDFQWLDEASTFIDGVSHQRFEAGVSVQRRFSKGRYAEAHVGGYEDGVLYGVEIGKFSNPGIYWSLGFEGNARGTQSSSLAAINGREDRVQFQVGGRITDRWVFEVDGNYFWSRVGGDRLGQGYGLNGALDYIIKTETPKRAEWSVGYYAEYQRFKGRSSLPPSVRREVRKALQPQAQVKSALAANEELRGALPADFGSEVMDSLIDPETNRHGVRMTLRKHFGDRWAAYVQGNVYYAVDEKSVEYAASIGAEYYLSQSALIYAELRYDSSGRALGTGGGVVEANLGGMLLF